MSKLKSTEFDTLQPNIKNMEKSPQLLDEISAAAILGVTPGTLQVWRCTKRYNLIYIKIGRLVKYRLADLMAFIESRTQNRV